jgi:transcriptional regulator with XRE-family HTH domain
MTGEQLRLNRKTKGFTQTDLAEKIGTVKNRISEWENGRYKISPVYRRLIENVFNFEKSMETNIIFVKDFFEKRGFSFGENGDIKPKKIAFENNEELPMPQRQTKSWLM